ncbi:hypothetical protein Tco_0604624 [Tanacetum coccineum]
MSRARHQSNPTPHSALKALPSRINEHPIYISLPRTHPSPQPATKAERTPIQPKLGQRQPEFKSIPSVPQPKPNTVDTPSPLREHLTPPAAALSSLQQSAIPGTHTKGHPPHKPPPASHDFASYLPTELKELLSKFTTLSGDIKELKQHVRDMEIELPGVLKEIPTKLETFTSTISSLTSQVVELKNIQWEFPTEFLDLPSKISSVQANLKCESQTEQIFAAC